MYFEVLPTLPVISFILSVFAFFLVREIVMKRRTDELLKEVVDRTLKLEAITQDERKARLEAEQSNIAKSVFLATMSHEIRTPMNGVIGMASLLKQTSLTGEQREYTDTILSSGESLLSVINDILDFSKIEAGRLRLETREFALREILTETQAFFAREAAKKDLRLTTDVAENVGDRFGGDGAR